MATVGTPKPLSYEQLDSMAKGTCYRCAGFNKVGTTLEVVPVCLPLDDANGNPNAAHAELCPNPKCIDTAWSPSKKRQHRERQACISRLCKLANKISKKSKNCLT